MASSTLKNLRKDSLKNSQVHSLFVTQVYEAKLAAAKKADALNRELLKEVYQIRRHDVAGQRWSNENFPGGYTSYSSMAELFRVSSTFLKLKKMLDLHVKEYAKNLEIDLKRHPLEMTHLWINVVPKHCYHGLHLHPLSTISGTYYLKVPPQAGEIKFEDPRMTCFMGSAPRKGSKSSGTVLKRSQHGPSDRFFSIRPKEGSVVMFESWLRHEVMQNLGAEDRVSLSFNYNWF